MSHGHDWGGKERSRESRLRKCAKKFVVVKVGRRLPVHFRLLKGPIAVAKRTFPEYPRRSQLPQKRTFPSGNLYLPSTAKRQYLTPYENGPEGP
jgi:hypothetical protein